MKKLILALVLSAVPAFAVPYLPNVRIYQAPYTPAPVAQPTPAPFRGPVGIQPGPEPVIAAAEAPRVTGYVLTNYQYLLWQYGEVALLAKTAERAGRWSESLALWTKGDIIALRLGTFQFELDKPYVGSL